MVNSGDTFPRQREAAQLRERAQRVRGYARMIPDDEAAVRLHQLADELDARAAALEREVKPDAPDP